MIDVLAQLNDPGRSLYAEPAAEDRAFGGHRTGLADVPPAQSPA